MRESPARHLARTGAPYAPMLDGTRLADDEDCPTLFRYPGPVALLEALERSAPSLAPPGAPVIWMHEHPLAAAPGPVGRFGTLVILEPLRLAPVRLEDAFAAAAQTVEDERLVWLPPARAAAGGAPWDRVATQADARTLLGGGWDDERSRVRDELGAYLEELSDLARTGLPPPPGAWCDVAPAERARLLAEHGLTGRWTPR